MADKELLNQLVSALFTAWDSHDLGGILMRAIAVAIMSGVGVLSACATAVVGKGNPVTFTSEPAGATVTAKDVKRKTPEQTCVTPCVLSLDRKWPHNVVFEKDGYISQKLMLTPKIATGQLIGGALSNSLTLGIGDAIDGPSAYYNDLKPNPLHAILEPIPSDALTE